MPARTELRELASRYDLIVVGGGITGAGILREAVRSGARVLLVEKNDFASGTSSASSKLVHGGLRYLKNGQWRLTLESVRERRRLLHEAAGLVQPQAFLMPLYRGMRPGKLTMQIGLKLYDLMAGRFASRFVPRDEVLRLEPQIRDEGLLGAMAYEDAQTDDARLVLRLIFEAVGQGATALNYVGAQLRSDGGRVTGVRLRDLESGAERDVDAGLVINATGPWAAQLAGAPGGAPKLRPLRGSHFVFARESLPVTHAVSWLHPRDRRPIFAYPWEGAVLYGTTDLDHDASLDAPSIGAAESAYLFEGLAHQFPRLRLGPADVVATYAGVRPVVASGKDDPSAESRESAQWSSPGLISITGGKLTTFRVTAHEVLSAATAQDAVHAPRGDQPVFEATAGTRLGGRLGAAGASALESASAADREPLAATPYGLAELRWSLARESVVHLDDLLLRRTRIGLVTRDGGAALLPRVAPLCQEQLGWSDAHWQQEVQRYQSLWRRRHAPPLATS